jgi:enoyl-CoA hydratase/carnithine racemase
MNAIDYELGAEIKAALSECVADERIRVVRLRGAGRAFCAGDDLGDFSDEPDRRPLGEPAYVFMTSPYYVLVQALRDLPKPVVAQVHGFAVAAGCDIALACDFCYAATSAKFGFTYSRYGMVGGTYTLQRHVSLKRATEILMSGRLVEAQEAANLGMITAAVPDDELDGVVEAQLAKLAKAPTRSLGYIKAGLEYSHAAGSLEMALRHESYLNAQAATTADFREGWQSFMEKREPEFTGR